MLEPPEASEEILDWLTSLRLPQYAVCFQNGGYKHLDDCKGLTEEHLLELQVLPTGHRRRILRSLDELGVEQVVGQGEEGDKERRDQKNPVPYPRHVFMGDKKREIQHKERSEYGLEGSQSLPPGVVLGVDAGLRDNMRRVSLGPPRPSPRNPCNIRRSSSTSGASSSDSLSVSSHSEMPSDWEISSEEPSLSSTYSNRCLAEELKPMPADDQVIFHGEMVENSIYDRGCSLKTPRGPRPTRSYRLRHRPVPEIPSQTLPLLQDRSASPLLTTSPEHLPGSEGPIGTNGTQKVLQRSVSRIVPYGETFLYNNPENILDRGPKELLRKEFKEKIKQKKLRKKQTKHKQVTRGDNNNKGPGTTSDVFCHYEDEYSMVDECTTSLQLANQELANIDTATIKVSGAGHTVSDSDQESSLKMTMCELYSEPLDTLGGLVKNTLFLESDISPYACFYGASKNQVVKAGWLDKLSPQGFSHPDL